ncbi:MAG: hypothetical protein N4A31_06535 [Rickettsiales bacterium]|jgi:hypothetical protein|nr:hypothetical protein [Rickettsiales bacterium]
MNKKILRIMTFIYTFMLAYNLAQGEILDILEKLGLYEPEQIIPQIDEDGADVILNSNEDY